MWDRRSPFVVCLFGDHGNYRQRIPGEKWRGPPHALVDARRSELRNRRQALQVRSAQYQATVGLVRALGGGWDAATGIPQADCGQPHTLAFIDADLHRLRCDGLAESVLAVDHNDLPLRDKAPIEQKIHG